MEYETVSSNEVIEDAPAETAEQSTIESVSSNDTQLTVSVGDAGMDITDETGTPIAETETTVSGDVSQMLTEIRDTNTGILTAANAALFLALVIWCVEKVQNPVRRLFFNAKSD